LPSSRSNLTYRRSSTGAAYDRSSPQTRPRDPIELGKLIVDIGTGQVKESEETLAEKRSRTTGRKGGAVLTALS
jgi:hypothetical protein